MSLQQQIREDMKESMKAKNGAKTEVLKGLMSAFTNESVAKGGTPQDELGDEDTLAVITRSSKQRKDSIEQFEKGGRADLAEIEKSELEILEAYLPELMGKGDILEVAEAKKSEMGIDDKAKMGMLMGAIMKELKGQADGGDVKEVVESLFN